MPDDNAQLQTVLKAKNDRDSSGNITSQVVSEMKSSLIFQISWPDLLQSGPTSLSSMGACFAASTNPNAALELTPPQGGYKYLKFLSVKANLIQCGNLGRYAFIEAESGMGVIQQVGTVMNGKMAELIQTIGDPQSAQKLLAPQLGTIQDGAQSCLDAITSADKKFDDWLLYTCELHAACVAHEQETHEALLSNQVCVAAEQTRLDQTISTVETAKKASDLMEKQVNMAGQAFKDASDKFPTGWDIMGQQIVGDLAHCATTALNAIIPALVDNLNPMKKLKAAGDVVGNFAHPDKGRSGPNTSETDSSSVPLQAPPQPNPSPKNAADPAYSEVLKLPTYLSALNAIVHGKDDDIDWDKATGNDTSAGARSSIKFLSGIFEDHKKAFSDIATGADPSQTLITVLEVCLKVASEISAEVAKAKDPQHNFPEKTSDTVKKWQTDFTAQYTKANTLVSTASSLPGSAAGGTPIMSDAEVQTAQINAHTTQAQAVLDSAKNRLDTTQKMLTTSQENYGKATELLVAQQNKLGEIQANLKKLTSTNLTLKEIKAILISCIQLIINLKQQITDLVRFLNALTVIIKVTVQTHVAPFLKTVKALVQDGSSDADNFKIGPYTLTDFQRTVVYGAVVTIRSYFGVFSDIAKMWIELSEKNIMPGLLLCDKCAASIGDSDPKAAEKLNQLVQALQTWSETASQDVIDIAGKAQSKIKDDMKARIANVEATTNQLDPPIAAAQQAITAGTNATKQAGEKYVADKKSQNGLLRFGAIDDI